MAPKQSNFIVRFVRGTYRALDASRRFAINLLFLFIVLLIVAAIAASAPALQEKTALVLAPQGFIVEQYSADATSRAIARMFGEDLLEVQLRDILRALDAAAKDPRIARVVIVPDGLVGAGMSTLHEIGAALERFKRSGKQVVAYTDGADQRGYLLAAHANHVYLNPEGAIVLEGIGRYRFYFKDAFDKLGVEAHLFRVGEYKSAGEPYVRSDQSPEAREADLYWMGDLWQRYLTDVAALRKIDVAELQAGIDQFDTRLQAAGGDFGKLALASGLVDGLKTRDEVRTMLIEQGAEDRESHSFRQVDVEGYVAALERGKLPHGGPRIAVVVAEGEIVGGEQPPGSIGGDSTSELIREAREDSDVKALVLRVDSPGGQVFPSELIRREVELTQAAGKPVVVSMGDVAASGGYWIAMDADEIVASPSTITGSIGIFAPWFNVPQAMDKLGLNTDGAETAWIVGAFDPTREYDPRVGTVIQSAIDHGYAQFIGKVAAARGKSAAEIDAIARGRVWSGAQAKERGLVDRLGTFSDALDSAARRAKLGDDYLVRYVEQELNPFERFMLDASQSHISAWVRAQGMALPASWLPQRGVDELAQVRRMVQDAIGSRRATIYAHCECGG